MKITSLFFISILTLLIGFKSNAQVFDEQFLFGSNNDFRGWNDVLRYDLEITPDFNSKTISGNVTITYRTDSTSNRMQIDLVEGMEIKNIVQNAVKLTWKRFGKITLIDVPKTEINCVNIISIEFDGSPTEAVLPPWDGGVVWTKDSLGRNWMSVACQGIGGSSWFPCKDYLGDKADLGMSLKMNIPIELEAVAGGTLLNILRNSDTNKTVVWETQSPISTYNIIPYIGHYKSSNYIYQGKAGELAISWFYLDYNETKALDQFRQLNPILDCFEDWFGPYPFYKDGFKLVEAPYLGMEHQGAVAYGNGFKNGYKGTDLSGTGIGLAWDFIIVHETAHEWFGNNITAADIADLWIHEAFANYAETIYTECQQSKDAADKYLFGIRKNILNDKPIIGKYNYREEGSSDMYYKGGNLVHLIRHYINDDQKFKSLIKTIAQSDQISTTSELEKLIQEFCPVDLTSIFDVYLRQKSIPVLQLIVEKKKYYYKWSDEFSDLNMPLDLKNGRRIYPGSKWQKIKVSKTQKFDIDQDFYIISEIVEK